MRRPVPWLIELIILYAYATVLMMLFGLALFFWVATMAFESVGYAAWMVVTGVGFLVGRWSLFHFIITEDAP